jgi:hypothetical protein
VDSSPLAIFAIDGHGLVTHWNGAAERLIGWTRNEVVGHELPFHPTSPLQCKNGSFIQAAVWQSPIHSLDGQPVGTVIIAAGTAALREAGVDIVPEAASIRQHSKEVTVTNRVASENKILKQRNTLGATASNRPRYQAHSK